ncbi:hypothetical protein KP509_01G021400 [Ceratopteris richardii]|uniref:C3H1-type domain-containing protein n=1 Tax=Ceratopteris richardii TaxID=49495 RepID=A0A8T2VF60_CERRI|nr:hypothetical protein KP509_01G021400 [Ceratopteris richardii]
MAFLNHALVPSASPACFSDRSPTTALCSLSKLSGPSTGGHKLVILSVTSLDCVRRPVPPRAGFLSKPSALISERVICTDVNARKKLEFKYTKDPSKGFCEFIESTSKEEVIAFFRDITNEVERFRQLQDFHFRVRDNDDGFRVEIFYNEDRRGPDVSPFDDCIGCSLDANLFVGQEPGMKSKECILEEFSDRPYAIVRLDVKGREGFSVMPVRHVERMSELDDDELYSMWTVVVRMLRQTGMPFISLILNHGSYRTLYHLNLKVWVDSDSYARYRLTWNKERMELWNRLQKYAVNRPKKQQVCFFFKRDGFCRHGEFCSYLHSYPKIINRVTSYSNFSS